MGKKYTIVSKRFWNILFEATENQAKTRLVWQDQKTMQQDVFIGSHYYVFKEMVG